MLYVPPYPLPWFEKCFVLGVGAREESIRDSMLLCRVLCEKKMEIQKKMVRRRLSSSVSIVILGRMLEQYVLCKPLKSVEVQLT